MNKFIKLTSLALCALAVLSQAVFANGGPLPVRTTLENKGYEISWIQETKTVVIRDGGFVLEEAVGEEISLANDTTYASESFFNKVDDMRKAYEEYSTNATVKEIGEGFFLAETEKLGEVMFRHDDKTHFHHEMNRMLYRANDLQVGSLIKVYFDVAMTASIPPQTYAIEVVFLNSSVTEEEARISASGEIKEAGSDYILVETDEMGEVIFKFDENTNLHHEMNRMFYAFTELKQGMLVTVYHAEAITASLPPQTYASEIVILNTAEPEKLTQTGKVTEVGENYFIIETENGEYQFNCDENTNFHHVMNRMLYRLESLEKDMELEVIHSEAATFSLPPQAYAIEVIIK